MILVQQPLDLEAIKALLVFCKENGIAKISLANSFEAIIPIVETRDVKFALPDVGVSDKPNPNFNPQNDDDLLFYSA